MKRERFDLSGRVALITGASRGIGKAIALGFAEHGADLVVHCASRREEAQKVADAAAACGVSSGVVAADLGAEDAPQQIYSAALKLLGRVDILVLNASTQVRKPWPEITRAEFDQQIAVNLRSSWELMQLTLPGMIQRRWGRVMAVGSVQQQVPHREMLVYGATKAAQLHMVRNLARQVAPHGVTVNNLAPGVIATDRNAAVLDGPAGYERVKQWVPANCIGQPEDCVGAALLLCSEAGRYITGADILVDGGLAA